MNKMYIGIYFIKLRKNCNQKYIIKPIKVKIVL